MSESITKTTDTMPVVDPVGEISQQQEQEPQSENNGPALVVVPGEKANDVGSHSDHQMLKMRFWLLPHSETAVVQKPGAPEEVFPRCLLVWRTLP